MVVTCCIKGCNETFRKGGPVTFHCLPKDENKRKLWEIKIGRENINVRQVTKVCSKHFTADCFNTEKFGGTWLKTDAVPTIFEFPDHLQKQTDGRKRQRRKRKSPKRRSSCTSYESETEGRPADHRDIDDPDWVPSINMGYIKNIYADWYESSTKIVNDGGYLNTEENTETEENRSLISEQIITNHSEISDSQDSLRTMVNSSFLSSERLQADQIHCNFHRINNKNKTAVSVIHQKKPITTKKFTFKYLLRNLSQIKKPNTFWGISSHLNFVICARWSEDYFCEKKIVIDDLLAVRAFLKELEINLSELMNITCIDDISNLLEKVESYKIS